ncbi:MAG: hypothetical protein MUC67_08695 [Acidobacteria bacterium]|nr:hypothetical protein [Acidobacteriota bacterium]
MPALEAASGPGSIARRLGLDRWSLPASPALRFALVAALSFVPYAFAEQTWVLAGWALRSLAAGAKLPLPSTAGLSTIPGRLVAFHLLFLATWWLPRAVRYWVIAAGALTIGIALRIIDWPSTAVLVAVALAFLVLFRMSIPRWSMLAVVLVTAPVIRGLGQAYGWLGFDRSGITIGLIVCLWYACYQVTTKKALPVPQYLGYVGTRLFMEGPVFTIPEFEPAARDRLDAVRLAGIRVLAIALFCRTVSVELDGFLEARVWRHTAGLELLGSSYLNYVAHSCEVVFGYNLALGLLRLFGLPIRNNFDWWLLARTPNEHWRRWNLLFREWLVTFTFYPMMRAKYGLFSSVMVTLLASGGLHLLAHAAEGALTIDQAVLTMSYWAMNGLLIWLVVDFPRRFPGVTSRLGLDRRWYWGVIGWVLTSAFYAIAYYINREAETLADVPAYIGRLLGVTA